MSNGLPFIFSYPHMHKVLFLALMLLIGAACSSTSKEASKQTPENDSTALQVALMPTADCLPFYYAAHYGIYDRMNAHIRIQTFMAQMDCDTAFSKSHADVAYTDLIRAALLQSKGSSLRVILQTAGTHQLITAATKRIRHPKQLKEKTVGMARHSVTDYLCDLIADTGNVHIDDLYKPQINDISLRAAMLENATLDAAFLPEPYATQARIRKNRCIYSSEKDTQGMLALMAHAKALNHPVLSEDIKKLIEGYHLAVAEMQSEANNRKAKQLLSQFGISQPVIDSLYLNIPVSLDSTLSEAMARKATEWLKGRNLVPDNYTGDTLLSSTTYH